VKKRHFVGLILLVFCLSSHSAFTNEESIPEVKTTRTGAKFTRVQTEFRQGWRNEKGLVWLDGLIPVLSQEDGVRACAELGARLPSKDEFIELFSTMVQSWWEGFVPEILPNLFDRKSNKARAFWTSTQYYTEYYKDELYYDAYRSGRFDVRYASWHGNFAWCVYYTTNKN